MEKIKNTPNVVGYFLFKELFGFCFGSNTAGASFKAFTVKNRIL
jgi:hypothetical protein